MESTAELRFERDILDAMPQKTCEIRRRIEDLDFEIRLEEIEEGKITGCTAAQASGFGRKS